MNVFVLLNTKEYILKNVGNGAVLVPQNSLLQTFLKISFCFGAPKLLCFPHSSEYIPLCSAEQIHSYRFGTTWGWANDWQNFHFWVNYPLIYQGLQCTKLCEIVHKLVYTVADPTLSHFYNSYTGTTGIQAYMCFLMHRLAVTDLSLTPMLSLGIDFQILWKLIHMNWSVRSTTLIIPQRREPAYSNSNFSPTTCNESSRIYPFRSHSAANNTWRSSGTVLHHHDNCSIWS